MKKIFEIIGLLSLASFSFFITEKTTQVFENVDNIMIQIKENYKNYNTTSQDAIIDNNTIIPGIYGREVNIKKSYNKMKKNGYYNEDMYVYDYRKPNISLNDNIDKYIISGNKNNRYISLIFKVSNKLNNILKIIDKYNIKVAFFVTNTYFEEHNDLIIELIKKGHIIGNLSNNLDYSDPSFGWMDTIIKSLTNQKQGYCYYTDNISNLEYCIKYKNYTIKPIEIKNNLLNEVKNNLKNGTMLSFEISNNQIKELDSIINYIISKGYEIVSIDKLLNEK